MKTAKNKAFKKFSLGFSSLKVMGFIIIVPVFQSAFEKLMK